MWWHIALVVMLCVWVLGAATRKYSRMDALEESAQYAHSKED